ncbi:MAG: hypothetical protein KDD37_10360, partial [Bdellovibrionales bacterium]|nr:hypothetical protein [Bdellovibrionales bacterium]
MDKDGKMDIVEFNSGRNVNSYIIYNRGVSNGVPQYERKIFFNHNYKSTLIGNLIDFDKDGDLDIAFVEMVTAGCTARDANNVCISWNISASGSSGSPVTLKLIVVVNQPDIDARSTRVSFDLPNTYHFDGDTNLFNKTLQVLPINQTGAYRNDLVFINDRFEPHYIVKFTNQVPVVTPVDKPADQYTGNYWSGVVGDLDKDGNDDFINLCSNGPSSGLYYGSSSISFDPVTLDDSCGLFGAKIYDVNKDGYNDIVAVQYQSLGSLYNLVVYYGLPNREFAAKELILENINPTYETGTPIEFVNLDGNNWMDFIV